MIAIPKKTEERLKVQGRKFQKPIKKAADRDINESDTVTLITDMLSDVFGWDKYIDLTSEHEIRGAYCDIAIKAKPENKIPWMIVEAKRIGINLSDNHLPQAAHYGADAGVEWIVLTTAMTWRVYRVSLTNRVNYELFSEFDFLNINFRSQNDLQKLFVLSKEGAKKDAIDLLYQENQLTN